MLDPDISTHDALGHLSVSEPDDPASLDRRRFLQLVGMGMGAGTLAGPGTSLLDSLTGSHDAAWAAGPLDDHQGIVVVIGLYGGNDGLNTVVRTNDGKYRDQRGNLAIDPGDTLRLDGSSGLNPGLPVLKKFWDGGKLAIVEGVGHTTGQLSHFASMATWMSGMLTGLPTSGWVGRWLDNEFNGRKELFGAAEIGSSVPLHMVGERTSATTVGLTQPSFGVPRHWRVAGDRALHSTVRTMARDHAPTSLLGAIGQAQVDQLDVARSFSSVLPDQRDGDSKIEAQLGVAARLINANLGFRVLSTGFGSFDSHAGQPSQHATRLRELNAGITKFFATLDPRWAGRVTVMTFSEFGRTPHGNAGQGTDHGTSAPQFVLGAGVRGGFYGQRPSLAGIERWGRMDTHVDARSYYASIIDGWLGGGSTDVLRGNFENLRLFRTAPSRTGSVPVKLGSSAAVTATAPSAFEAVTPERIFDSRTGLGGPRGRIGPGETIRVAVSGAGPVPADATAVAVNVTAVYPTADSYLTVYPTGEELPDSSTLNPRPGIVTPNSTIVGVGSDGTISIFNRHGHADVLVDVMGVFVPGGGERGRFQPLSPSRLLDTRDGNGVAKRRIRQRSSTSLQVTGRGGVPSSGVDAVVVNLLAIRPNGEGWVVGWPSGEPMPVVSNVQYQTGRTVPTLAVVKVGQGGRIDLMASDGDLDMVVDVVGFFGTQGSLMQAVDPQRLLDTRSGNGAPRRRVGRGGEITLQVVGRGGVPDGATAAALNVTAVAPTEDTYLTVYPGGERRRSTSSLNPDRGQVSANLVVSKIGGDGTVKIYSNRGDVDLVADLTAYFV
ncbi:MAG: DUF1501 domain-containing protein [Ilumatobacter sp.]